MARAEGEENCRTRAGLVVERERIAPFEDRNGIIFVAMEEHLAQLAIREGSYRDESRVKGREEKRR